MGVVRNLMVRAGADFSPLESAMSRSASQMKSFGSKMESALSGIKGKLLALGAAYVGITGLKDATQDAIELEATTDNLNHVLGQSSQAYIQWSQTVATSYGFSQVQAEKYGSSFSHMISLFTSGSQQITQRTEDLMKTAAIIANGTGRSIEDVMMRIRSGMLGNVQAINDLGVYANQSMLEMSQGFKEIANGRSWDKLTMAERQQVIYLSIMEQATKQFGDTVQNNVHNKLVTFTASLRNLRVNIGNAFLPILNVALPALTALAQKLVVVAGYVAQFMKALFGMHQSSNKSSEVATSTANKHAAAVNKLGDSYTKAGKAAADASKKASGSLAGFDEINSLADNSGGSAGGVGAGGAAADISGAIPMPDTGPVENGITKVSSKIKYLADKVRGFFTGIGDFFKGIGSFISENRDIIISALSGIAAGFASFLIIANIPKILSAFETLYLVVLYAIDGIKAGLASAFTFLLSPVGLIVVAIAAAVAAFVYFYRTNDKFRGFVDGILNQIKDAAIYLWKNVLVPLGEFLGKVFVAAWDAVKVAAEWLWKNVLVPLGTFLLWIWNNAIVPLAGVLKDVLGIAFKFVADVAQSLWKNVLVPLGDFFKAAFGPTVEAISAVFSFLWKYVLVPFGTFLGEILKPAFSGLVTVILFLWNNVLEPLIVFLAGVFKQAFDTIFSGIGKVIKDLQKIFIGLMHFITDIFTGNWKKAWEDVKSIFKGIFEGLWDIVKIPLNLIIDGINMLIGGLNSLHITIPDWVTKITGLKGSWGINIPKIPHLAKGGITNGPMMALIGDNTGGQEVVSPLSDLTSMITSAVTNAMMTALQLMNTGSNHQGDIVLKLDGSTFARIINPHLIKENIRVGGIMIQPK